jgi:hypothetical protein
MKWHVVPPSISIDGRGGWVRTKTGVWNGGLKHHGPFHSSVASLSQSSPESDLIIRGDQARYRGLHVDDDALRPLMIKLVWPFCGRYLLVRGL